MLEPAFVCSGTVPLCRESARRCRKNALVWNDLSSHCGTAPAGRAAVGGSCDGGSPWYSRIAREGAGMVRIRRELPRTIGASSAWA